MNLELNRKHFTHISTIGELSIQNPSGSMDFECYILEDTDRKLEDPHNVKIPHQTCIPRGRYEIVVTLSKRFGRMLPLLVNVPQYDGIRVHPGNKPSNTDGCLLPGMSYNTDYVGSSVEAWGNLYDKILKAHNSGEPIWINIR